MPSSSLLMQRSCILKFLMSVPRQAFFLPLLFSLSLTFLSFQEQIKRSGITIPSESRALAHFSIEEFDYHHHHLEDDAIVNTSNTDSKKFHVAQPFLTKAEAIISSGTILNKNDTTPLTAAAAAAAAGANHPSMMMAQALECLRQTKPDLPDLIYPDDAYEHYQEIHTKLDSWTQKSNHKPHKGRPWIENHWITYFQKELVSKNNSSSLSDVFGPYIPIFVPWTDIWVGNRFRYPKDLTLAMSMDGLLRDDVMYITVSQNDDGFIGRCSEFHDIQRKYHITVLSAGGYGHVPIPLLKQSELPTKKTPPGERKHLISYVGSNGNAPEYMRQKMIAQGQHYYKGDQWRDVMRQSKFQLCPRGFGRTSYHVQETLQMGLIPVQVYLDQAWLPYGKVMENISFSTTVDELPALVNKLAEIPDSEISNMEREIEKMRIDYFSFEGAMKNIGKFMLNPITSELLCQVLPNNAYTGDTRMRSCAR